MPYITQEDRDLVEQSLEPISTPGQLNYLFTSAIAQYVRDNKLSYQTINDIIGALEGAKLEFYRRIATPYENEKLTTNGDVY